jgi:CMP-N-acetylneuraminic acid synthetase
MRVLGVVPARGGSKGIPRKNLRLLGGAPLLEHTARAALAEPALQRVILSTDDSEIAELGTGVGLDVPFIRPESLAGDEAPTLGVVQHALRFVEDEGDLFDAVCLLQPTSPLRAPGLIGDCIRIFEQRGADSVVTVLSVPAEHNPHWVYFSDASGWLSLSTGEDAPISRRQELPPAFHREGSVYVTRADVVHAGSLYGRRVAGFPVAYDGSVNLDTEEDWIRAEALLAAESNQGTA